MDSGVVAFVVVVVVVVVVLVLVLVLVVVLVLVLVVVVVVVVAVAVVAAIVAVVAAVVVAVVVVVVAWLQRNPMLFVVSADPMKQLGLGGKGVVDRVQQGPGSQCPQPGRLSVQGPTTTTSMVMPGR